MSNDNREEFTGDSARVANQQQETGSGGISQMGDQSGQEHLRAPRQRFGVSSGSRPSSFVMDMDPRSTRNDINVPLFYQPENLPGIQPQMIIGGRRIPNLENQEEQTQDQSNGTESGQSNDQLPNPRSFFSQLLSQNPELAVVVRSFEKYIPFLLIVAAKGVFDHATGIFVFVCLFVTFYHANSVIKREIGQKDRRNLWPILAVLVNLSACLAFLYFIFNDQRLFILTVFLPLRGGVESFTDLLWILAANDFILKFVAVISKIFVVLLPVRVLAHRKRGNCFLFIEMTNQLHRSLVPIQVWLTYLLQGGLIAKSKDTEESFNYLSTFVGMILMVLYMVAKGKLVLNLGNKWRTAATNLWQSTRYGTAPTEEDLKASGGQCPICHDNLKEPSMLHCKHIFCEECVATWFDRERTCPMCRAQVTEDPAWRDGSTSLFIQLF